MVDSRTSGAEHQVGYDIRALLERFDSRQTSQTPLVGRLSALIGESVLLEALGHWYGVVNADVRRLPGVPHRDDRFFSDTDRPVPRDLDAWLELDGSQVVAVECKNWTASSLDGRHLGLAPPSNALAELALECWRTVHAHLQDNEWTKVSKIALPLRPPHQWPTLASTDLLRTLAIWRPCSENGISPASVCLTETLSSTGSWVRIPVTVFSASLYLRGLLAAGTTVLPARLTHPAAVLDYVTAVLH